MQPFLPPNIDRFASMRPYFDALSKREILLRLCAQEIAVGERFQALNEPELVESCLTTLHGIKQRVEALDEWLAEWEANG